MQPRRESTGSRRFRRSVLIVVIGLLAIAQWPPTPTRVDGQDENEPLQPAARRLTLQSPITDETINWVKRNALELQNIAATENRRAFLILEVTPGDSQFHHVFELSRFLTSADVPDVKTVAWVPGRVRGHNVIVALACNEIVMHPDAELGDIGLGRALDAELQTSVRNLVAKRRNTRVNESLAEALMDPQATLVQLTVEPQPGVTEKRLVTEAEAERIRASGIVIKDRVTIKEPGTPGLFSGDSARNHDILVVQTAVDLRGVAESYRLPPEALREERAPGDSDAAISLIEVHGVIDPVMETFLLRQIDRAVAQGARTIIFDVDSPGGGLHESHDLAFAIADLEKRNVRTVAWIDNHAISGGAFIALGCDEIYMRGGEGRSAYIGDILPIEVRPGQPFERAPEKILAPLREWLRDIAELKGRPPSVTMAMADPAIEVFQVTNRHTGAVWYMSEDELHRAGDAWDRGRMIEESREGIPLHVGAQRAYELKIAAAPVANFESFLQQIGLPPDVVPHRIGQTWVDGLIFTLNHPWVVGLLFFIGIICIYLELHFMTGLLGIISAVCFGLFFWSKVLGGTAGWLEVVLFLLGLGCIAMEIFVIPGFGVFGVSGGLLIFASLIMASQTFGNYLEPGRDVSAATHTLGTLSAAILAVIVMAMAISRFLPRIPLLNQLILTPPGTADPEDPDAPRLKPELTDSAVGALLHSHGTAMTVLRPSGKATIGGRLVDVVSDGGFIPEGSAIEVVQVLGNRIVVREARG